MLRFALFGAGRIGRMHADNLARHTGAELACVYDVAEAAARQVADKHGARVADTVDAALAGDVDAVLIASSTDTHVDLIEAAAARGKAILCEKPIDLSIERVEACREKIAGTDVPVMVGFNRRFDPTHRAVRDAATAGEIGTIEQVVISSRDPGPPPRAYLEVCGGLFRDMMIHDFDLARFVLGEEPVEVTALGSALFDANARDLGDIDSGMVLMRTESGKLAHVNCSRRAVYGYDQRLEIHGSEGMLRSGNRRATEMDRWSKSATACREPLLDFFIERYADAYVAEIDEFLAAVSEGRAPSVGFEDGRRALLLADAALESLKTGKTVRV